MTSLFKIELRRGQEPPFVIDCNQVQAFLGKDSSSLVELKGWRVGRRQLQFDVRTSGIWIRDGGGMVALKVNGNVISEYGPLADRDIIELADYRVRACLMHGQQTDIEAVAVNGANNPSDAPIVSPRAPVVVPTDTVKRPRVNGHADREIRELLHKCLIAAMDLRRINVSRMGDAELRQAVGKLIEEIISTDPAFKNHQAIKDKLHKVVLDEVVGLGPLEELLADDTVTEIMVNRYDEIFIERQGRLEESEISFSNDASVIAAIERIVSPLGRRIDEASPMVDARLKDGSRVNAVIPPLAIRGPSITIRKFAKHKLTGENLIGFGSTNAAMLEFLRMAVQYRANIVISGGTGSGKTTLLNILSNYIPDDERIVTVEDAAELKLTQPNLVSLEARPANIEGRGAVTIRDLVKNCLRMRPDRIVVGECRGGEALDMLQAMNTGHDGSLTTAHANTPRDCLSRLEVMTLMSGLDIPIHAIRDQMCSAVDIIVQQTRFSCGSRRITHITEVVGIERDVIQMQDIFLFKQEGLGTDGRIRGRFVATGHIPDFYQDLIQRGIAVNRNIFQSPADVAVGVLN